MKKDKEWLEKEINKTLNIDGGSGERIEGFNKGLEFSLDLIEELDQPEVPVIPQFVADYLSNADVYSFEERIEILINSHSGDSYYFHEMLPKDGHISYELGDQLYEYAQNEKLTNLFRLINGYTIEKEPKWTVKLDKGRYVDNFVEFAVGIQIDITSKLDCTAPIRFKDKSKAEAVALLVGGEVVEATND